jgi:hypothetical protein
VNSLSSSRIFPGWYSHDIGDIFSEMTLSIMHILEKPIHKDTVKSLSREVSGL